MFDPWNSSQLWDSSFGTPTFGASNDLPVVCMKQNRVGFIKVVRKFVPYAK